jgi:NDP-4-keto-2,6-dideoxyhexose 3-C-methyltransferase
MTPIETIHQCRICGNTRLVPIISLGNQALTGIFPGADQPDPALAPLELVACDLATPDACGLVQLKHNIALETMFGDGYGYRSSVTQTMRDHLGAKVRDLMALTAIKPGQAVLDIGCNDGTLLGNYPINILRHGIDPSSGQFAQTYPSDIKLAVNFFSGDRVRAAFGPDIKFQIITSIAMFYDVPDPLGFMKDIRSLLTPEGVWETEQAYLAAMIDALTYDTICHEHVSYYGFRQFEWLASRAGLKIIQATTNNINGGSFRLVLARDDSPHAVDEAALNALRTHESRFWQPGSFDEFAAAIVQHRQIVQDFFVRHRGQKILGYGASTKGNVLLQYAGISITDMPAILERDPRKFGRVTPGTRIPIISEADGRAQTPDFLFVLPWHFRDEMIVREADFLAGGGKLIFPLPKFEIVGVE